MAKEYVTAILTILLFLTGGVEMSTVFAEGSAAEKMNLNIEDLDYLKRIEKSTFRGFGKLIDPATQFPVDIASISTGDVVIDYKNQYFNKTSPTNIGLGFLYLVLAKERAELSQKDAYKRALQMMDTLEKLETHEGFLFNWYYLDGRKNSVPRVSQDRFISSLDNGDMDICLMAAAGAFSGTELSERIDAYLEKKDYHFFFDKNPTNASSGMISVGYDEAKKRYHAADYSIFNIEGRMTVLISILKDGIPDSAWMNMSRLVKSYTILDGKKISVVAPWGGSLYETLFADEIIGGYKIAPKAFYTNAFNMIQIHQDYGKRVSKSGIWGFSNGEVPAENKYEMAGVPEIAYNRFPGEFVTIYSAFLSLRYAPKAVIQNLKNMEELNPKAFNYQYGFTDSMDPKTGTINKNILSLDKGMELLSIGNFMSKLKAGKEIPDFLWLYFKHRGWDEKAKSLIQAEEQNPSFQAIAQHGEQLRPAASKNTKPIDLMEARQDIGTFYEPDRAAAAFKLIDSDEPGKQIIQIHYDVTQRYSFAGLYIKLDQLDITDHEKISFQIMGDKEKGFPKSVKVELKSLGKYVAFEHVSVSGEWIEKEITLPPGNKIIDEVAFVFENAASLTYPTGVILIRSLAVLPKPAKSLP